MYANFAEAHISYPLIDASKSAYHGVGNIVFRNVLRTYQMDDSNLKPFSSNVPLLYPLKTSENLRFSDVFIGYRGETLVKNGLNSPSFPDLLSD